MMEFTLYYQGRLKSNARPVHKHLIRKCSHRQLQVLWSQPPLARRKGLLIASNPLCVLRTVAGHTFAPLVSEKLQMLAELRIILLRPGVPGSLVGHAGDIDNRLKTLLDALRAPQTTSDLPAKVAFGPDEQPFFSLFEDDRLITGLAVETHQLLLPGVPNAEVIVLVHVTTKLTEAVIGTLGL
jgi:hypothetical protein